MSELKPCRKAFEAAMSNILSVVAEQSVDKICSGEEWAWQGWKAAWNTRADSWISVKERKPSLGQRCIVSAGPDNIAQVVALVWDGAEFVIDDQLVDFIDPFPSEMAKMWMPWPDDPKPSPPDKEGV